MGAIKREMNNWKWTLGAIAYMCVFAYAISLVIYQIGAFCVTLNFTVGTAAAILIVAMLLAFLFRKNKYNKA